MDSMRSASPDFVINERNKGLLAELYAWVWARLNRTKPGALDPSKGILFWGEVGTGKTTLLKGLQHYLATINKLIYGYANSGICFEIRSAAEIALRYSSEGMNALNKWVDREQISHLAIDEIGREEISKHFGTTCNTIQTVLQLRYEQRHKTLTLGSTNLNMDDSFQFKNLYGEFVLDRTKELFNVIEVGGDSRRK
ncbi:MAG: ATP-binding protein [Phocaeicola sp.]